jgi:hypothetical protein
MKIGIVELIYIIILFQLLIFFCFSFVSIRANCSNYLLGIQLISQAGGILNHFSFLQYDYFLASFPTVFFVGLPFQFLWGPTFYLYVKSAAYNDFKLRFNHVVHFIPFIITVVYLSISFFSLVLKLRRCTC